MSNYLKMAAIHSILALHQQGWSQRRIARELGLDRETVARHIRQANSSKPAIAPTGSVDPAEPSKPAIAPTGSDDIHDGSEPAAGPSVSASPGAETDSPRRGR